MEHNTTDWGGGQVRDVNAVLAAHERLVHWVVPRQGLGGLSYAAAVPAGRLALWRAAQGYDLQRGVAFSSYAVPAIRRAVWRALATEHPPAFETLWAQPPQAAPEPESAVHARLVGAAERSRVAQLPVRLRYVIVAHYGLAEAPAQSFTSIGQALGVTRQRAQQLHAEALRWLAHPAHSLALRQLVDRNTTADYRAFLAQQRRWLRRRQSP